MPGRRSVDTVDHVREHVHNDRTASVRGDSAHPDGRRYQNSHNDRAHPDQRRRKAGHLGGAHSDYGGHRRPAGHCSSGGGGGRVGHNNGKRRHTVFQAGGRQDYHGRRNSQAADVRRQRGRETYAQARRVFG